MSNTRAEAFAPATVANLGVGFDLMGMAVEGAGDIVCAEWRDEPGAIMRDIQGDDGKTPYAADENIASVAANAFLQEFGIQRGVALTLKKGLPIASGLGSSAASAVAAVVAVNALLDEPYPREALLPAALEGEAIASKSKHADNVAPCLLGGITLSNGIDISQITRLPVPDNLYYAIVTPQVAVKTSEARSVLPEHVTLKQMVRQTGAVAELIDALYREDIAKIGTVMEKDCIIEPARAALMPCMEEIRHIAKENGAYGLVISGAGPSLCAICDTIKTAKNVAEMMQQTYQQHRMNSLVRYGTVLKEGAEVLSVS